MNKKENSGFQKTHQTIKNCLSEMIQTQSFKQITVNSLCMAANINRSTFYAHFDDIYDVLSQISHDMDLQLLKEYETSDISPSFSSEDYVKILLEHLKKNRRFYCVLLGDPSNPVLLENMNKLQQLSSRTFPGSVSDRISHYYFEFMKAGFLCITKEWLDDNCPETPLQMAQILLALRPVYHEKLIASLNL